MLSLIGGREEYRWHISMWNKYNAYPKTERKRSEREIKRDGERANERAKKRKKNQRLKERMQKEILLVCSIRCASK